MDTLPKSLYELKLNFDKFWGADFKYDNGFFKISDQKYPNKAFLFPNLGISEILQLGKFEGADFKFDKIVFKFQSKKAQIRHFLSQI